MEDMNPSALSATSFTMRMRSLGFLTALPKKYRSFRPRSARSARISCGSRVMSRSRFGRSCSATETTLYFNKLLKPTVNPFLSPQHHGLLKGEALCLKHRPDSLAKVGKPLTPLDFRGFVEADSFLALAWVSHVASCRASFLRAFLHRTRRPTVRYQTVESLRAVRHLLLLGYRPQESPEAYR